MPRCVGQPDESLPRSEVVEEGADQHIDAMAKKYLGEDTYPFRQPGEERVIEVATRHFEITTAA